MRKRYQVFISSTMTDLENQRKQIIKLLRKGHRFIPSYMEDFIATGENQMDYIKQMIDDSDIYVLVIGCTSGSIDPSTGKSYTEQEYDYARSRKVPVLPFYCEDPKKLPDRPTDDQWNRMKAFKTKVQETLCGRWHATENDLAGQVLASVNEYIADHPNTKGWVRGTNETKTDGTKRVTAELRDPTLTPNNSTLTERNIHRLAPIEPWKHATQDMEFSTLSIETITVKGNMGIAFQDSSYSTQVPSKVPIGDIFRIYGDLATTAQSSTSLQKDFVNEIGYVQKYMNLFISDEDYRHIENVFNQKKLIAISMDTENHARKIVLTQKGFDFLRYLQESH